MKIIRSSSTDVYHNLALEDALLDDPSITPPVLLLYRNDDAVVLGKNQVPWRECNVPALDGMGIRLARRVTGGGTVFHDAGNLNISLLLPRESYVRGDVMQLMMDGLEACGLQPEVTNDTSIVVEGRKVSGNAFCFRRDRVLHHGTLLWNANLARLRAALLPALDGIETRAIASVPMAVHNLAELLPGKSPEEFQELVIRTMAESVGDGSPEQSAIEPAGLSGRIEKMKSWEWLYGATPDFTWTDERGDVPRTIDVHRGLIQGISPADESLVGLRFDVLR